MRREREANMTVRDGGKERSGQVFRRFVREWNARGRTRIPGRVRPIIPAVVKIPRIGGGTVKVWVKSLAGGDLSLAKEGRIHGDFLAVFHSGAFHIMSANEARRAQVLIPDECAALNENALCGREAWGKLENAVRG